MDMSSEDGQKVFQGSTDDCSQILVGRSKCDEGNGGDLIRHTADAAKEGCYVSDDLAVGNTPCYSRVEP